MKLSPITKTENTMTFRVEGVTAAYLNTLRRMMMTEVPTIAIERVEFSKNNSIIYDEMLAHRLGLVPLKSDLASYSVKENYGEPGNPATEVTLTLQVPKAKGSHTVTAGEFVSSDPNVKPVHENMPLVRLLEGQDLELIAYGELGFGKDHMKWSPALVTYKYFPTITITKQPRNAKRVAERYPALFEVKGDKLVVTKDAGAHMPDLDLDMDDGEVSIANSDDFLLTIESWGQLSPESIVEEAIKRYDEKLEVFANSL